MTLTPEMPDAGEHHDDTDLVGGLITLSLRAEPQGSITAAAPGTLSLSSIGR